MKYVLLVTALLLGGCVHSLPTQYQSAPKHHVAKPISKPAPALIAPAPQAETPKQKTFKRKWLRLFFRDRATR